MHVDAYPSLPAPRHESFSPAVAAVVKHCLALRRIKGLPRDRTDPTCDLAIDTPCGPTHHEAVTHGPPDRRRPPTGDVVGVIRPGLRTMELYQELLDQITDQDTQPIDMRHMAAVR